MNSSQDTDHRRRLWIVILRGHHDEVELAVASIHENQAESFLSHQYHGDDDEITATILLRWIDTVMPKLVHSIIESDFPSIRIVRNREVTEHDNEVSGN